MVLGRLNFGAIAVHQQQNLDDRFTAVRSFDKALDFDPGFLEAFEAIANILNQDRDYARQDRYYRKMLKRALENKLTINSFSHSVKDWGRLIGLG